MKTWVVLLRGINVGGKNIVAMAALRTALEAAGFEAVRTYIQSGNLTLRSSASRAGTAAQIAETVEAHFGVQTTPLVLTPAELRAAENSNPFPEAAAAPKTLHVFFLAQTAKRPDTTGIDAARAASERTKLSGRTFYLHAPDGIARSKLATKAEALLGVPATARNLRTVTKLLEMLDAD
ncbi:MAG: DUF1697 domain-containing protein [Planctomycetota bacterium]